MSQNALDLYTHQALPAVVSSTLIDISILKHFLLQSKQQQQQQNILLHFSINFNAIILHIFSFHSFTFYCQLPLSASFPNHHSIGVCT